MRKTKSQNRPWLLRILIDSFDHDSLLGDLDEMYAHRLESEKAFQARLWYWSQVLRLILPGMRHYLSYKAYMFHNHVKITCRTINRQKSFSLINIFGLALGMACCILILFYLLNELSYDRYHMHANRVFRIRTQVKMGGRPLDIAKSSPIIVQTLEREFPEIQNTVMLHEWDDTLVKFEEKSFMEDGIIQAGKSLFQIFSFPLIRGNPETALSLPDAVVISESKALKYFGEANPLGKTLKFDNQNFTITGVFQDIPSNSHFDFDMACSYDMETFKRRKGLAAWLYVNFYSYLLLQEDIVYTDVENKFPAFVQNHMGEMLGNLGAEITMTLQPLPSIHLHSHLQQELSTNGNILYVYIFSAAAMIILLVACLNFMNLSTARSATRVREVGVRKVMGADRKRLVFQFLGESLFFSLLAFVFALILVEILGPVFNSLSGLEIHRNYFQSPWLFPGFLGLILLVAGAAGAYPALYLSSFQPHQVLSGRLKTGAANSRFRQVLVTLQFGVSVVLILGSLVVFRQLHYMKNNPLGFSHEHIVVIPIRDGQEQRALEAFKQEILPYTNVIGATASSHVPGQTTFKNPFLPEGFAREELQWLGEFSIDPDFLEVMEIPLVEGRNFIPDSPAAGAILINQAAGRLYGWENSVGKTIQTETGGGLGLKWTVIGVVQDFHTTSLRHAIDPLIIYNDQQWREAISIKTRSRNIATTLDFLETKWQEFAPGQPFEYFFLDDNFDRQYRSDERMSHIFSGFTLLAVFIACLGLFGLASFLAEQRTKEIGIRKILGASAAGLVLNLSRDFIKWVIVANLFAWPLAFYIGQRWLESFAYRTSFRWDIFVIAGGLSLSVALLTVLFQTLKAARADPVDSLRYE